MVLRKFTRFRSTFILLCSLLLMWASILSLINVHSKKGEISNEDEFRWTNGETYANRSFNKTWRNVLKNFGLMNGGEDAGGMEYVESVTVEEIEDENGKTIIVTAFSSNHFYDAQAMLNSLKKYSSQLNPIVYIYDIGLEENMVTNLLNDYGSFIQIEKFNFQFYPDYVSDLHQYRWKPLIVAQFYATRNYKQFWWFDSSVRIMNDGNVEWFYKGYPEKLYPIIFTHHSSHSIFAATNPQIYEYFPITGKNAKNTDMYGATVFAVFRRPEVEKDILKWWVLCALEESCMAPVGSQLGCRFGWGEMRNLVYAGCHRYDQSVINILVATANNYDTSRYFRDTDKGAIKVERLQ